MMAIIRSEQRVPLSFIDNDPRRARLFADLRSAANARAGTIIEVTAPTAPNTDFGVAHHALGKKIAEFEVISQDVPGSLTAAGRNRWTKQVSRFKFSGAGGRLRIRVR
jgi:hypothetical protein